MKKFTSIVAASLVLVGCSAKPAVQPPPTQGYADGTKTLQTNGLTFTATGKGINIDKNGAPTQSDLKVVYKTTGDPDVIIATVDGTKITLTFDGIDTFSGGDTNYDVHASIISATTDEQSTLFAYYVGDNASGGMLGGVVSLGLPTNPSQVAALSGSATYDGTAVIGIMHGDFLTGNFSDGAGSATLTANFGSGTVGGTMSITDTGGSDLGFEISPTTVTINNTAISGNGFTTSLTLKPADFAMSSVTSTTVDGYFYGVDAVDVGGAFSGAGISAGGSTPAIIIGGFTGE